MTSQNYACKISASSQALATAGVASAAVGRLDEVLHCGLNLHMTSILSIHAVFADLLPRQVAVGSWKLEASLQSLQSPYGSDPVFQSKAESLRYSACLKLVKCFFVQTLKPSFVRSILRIYFS